MSVKRVVKTFSVDSDVIGAVRPLAKKYGVNLSEAVNNTLLMLLHELRSIEKLVESNPEGVPLDVARSYLNQKVVQASGDSSSLIEDLLPASKKVKVKK